MPRKPESAAPFPIVCVQEFGFSDSDFLYVVKRFPAVLLCRAEGNLRPKLRYFRTLGLLRPQLVAMVKAYPCLLAKNLHSAIKPKVTHPPRQGLPDGRDVLPRNDSGCFSNCRPNLRRSVFTFRPSVEELPADCVLRH
jgi:hypothetical protein